MGTFTDAVRHRVPLRIGLYGPPGCGKTTTALQIGTDIITYMETHKLRKKTGLDGDGMIALLDTEERSSDLNAYDPDDGTGYKFRKRDLASHDPETYAGYIEAARREGYWVIIIDSLSHEWMGEGGILSDIGGYQDWKKVNPRHFKLFRTIIGCGVHVICTFRAVTETMVDKSESGGIGEIKQLGLKPQQGKDVEYELDLLFSQDKKNNKIFIEKARGTTFRALKGQTVSVPLIGDRDYIREESFAWKIMALSQKGRPEEVQKPAPVSPFNEEVSHINNLFDELKMSTASRLKAIQKYGNDKQSLEEYGATELEALRVALMNKKSQAGVEKARQELAANFDREPVSSTAEAEKPKQEQTQSEPRKEVKVFKSDTDITEEFNSIMEDTMRKHNEKYGDDVTLQLMEKMGACQESFRDRINCFLSDENVAGFLSGYSFDRNMPYFAPQPEPKSKESNDDEPPQGAKPLEGEELEPEVAAISISPVKTPSKKGGKVKK